MADPNRAIRSIAVIGGGIVGLSAALAFRHALPHVTVNVIETPPDPAALVDRLPTAWPSIARFHAAIGLSDTELLRTGAATPLLGVRFEDPASGRPPFFLVHGQYGVPIGSVPFHRIWARAWRAGRAHSYADYSAAAVLAAAGRFVHPEEDPRSPLSTYDYGWRLDPPRYGALLAAIADRTGISRTPGVIEGVTRRADGGIATVRSTDRRDITADLFIDCAGPQAPLATLLDLSFNDWDDDLRADRVMLADEPAAEVASCDDVTATPVGWSWAARLPERTMRAMAFHAPDARRAAALTGAVDPEIQRLRPGWRDPWRCNLLVIGDAAIAAGPVPGVHLHLAHLAIARALDLLPDRDCQAIEIDEYRRRTGREATRLRDFLALFEQGGVTEGLTEVIDQFVTRGRFATVDDDAISAEIWIASMIGRGFVPRSMDALGQALDPRQGEALLVDLAGGLATLPGQLPPYTGYLRQVLSVRPRSVPMARI